VKNRKVGAFEKWCEQISDEVVVRMNGFVLWFDGLSLTAVIGGMVVALGLVIMIGKVIITWHCPLTGP